VTAALVAVLGAASPADADLIPCATGNRVEHLDLCNPDNSNLYVGPLGSELAALYPFTDNLASPSPRLYELELIAIGIMADVVKFEFPAETTPRAVWATTGWAVDPQLGLILFTYHYAAWTEPDKPTETGMSSYGVENQSVFNIYYSLAVTETYSGQPTTLNPPDALPGWFNMATIIQNAVAPPMGGPAKSGRSASARSSQDRGTGR